MSSLSNEGFSSDLHFLDWSALHRRSKQNRDSQDQQFRGRTVLIHQNLKDGNVSLRLINVTKEDEGNYSCWFPNSEVKSTISLEVVSQNNTETHKDPGSGLSSGVITLITLIVLGVGGLIALVIFVWKRNPAVL
ncbi:hypothetical protein OJAV_G00184730 [Oryzias javanicus]|uniref:Immunoglobulin V-set domain-containing protein n=1 Tax=Oryzias javanicus TaxID=123683 RepID=A0A3S2NW82_ORYJA|nr:hypothetical protein OJAV_G00184730 [Oryzias javanicus]